MRALPGCHHTQTELPTPFPFLLWHFGVNEMVVNFRGCASVGRRWDEMSRPCLARLAILDPLQGSEGAYNSRLWQRASDFASQTQQSCRGPASFQVLVPNDASALIFNSSSYTRNTEPSFYNFPLTSCSPPLSRGSRSNSINLLKAWCRWRASKASCEEFQ